MTTFFLLIALIALIYAYMVNAFNSDSAGFWREEADFWERSFRREEKEVEQLKARLRAKRKRKANNANR